MGSPARTRRKTALVAFLCLAALPLRAQVSPIDARPDNPFYEKLSRSWEQYRGAKLEDALAGFRVVLQEAGAVGDLWAQAGSHYGLGAAFHLSARYPAAREEFAHALRLYRSAQDEAGMAYALGALGDAASKAGDNGAARAHYGEALAILRRLDDPRQLARVVVALAIVSDELEGQALLDEQLSVTRRSGDKQAEAMILHLKGDHFFNRGQFDAAEEYVGQAAKLAQDVGDKHHMGRILTSEGRIQRAHGHPERAIEIYREALKLQQEVGDREGQLQTISAMALAHESYRQPERAVELYEQALALAQETGSERFILFASGNLASVYKVVGRNREAAELLEKIVDRDKDHPEARFAALSEAYFNLRRFARARDAAGKAIELARARGNTERLALYLLYRVRARSKLGELQAALADAQECLRVIEERRAHLVPSDFMKRGFSEIETTRWAFDLTIDLLLAENQPERALEVAEQARSRAFLDLLATRELQGPRGEALAALRKVHSGLAAQGFDPSAPSPAGADAGLWKQWINASPELRSLISVPSVSLSQVQATAVRLNSTILSYWVSKDATYVWVIPPVGQIHWARAVISEQRLTDRIRALWPSVSGADAKSGFTRRHLALRSGNVLMPNAHASEAWRELYSVLIRPVKKWLPARAGSLLTVEAHGPLLMLPFAGLRDERGQYLVERFTLHSIPAISLLQFTGHKAHQDDSQAPSYLLLADPAGPFAAADGKPLAPLPGARQEISSISRMLKASSFTILLGRDASERRFGELARRSSVIHLATHGIISDNDPMASFLALSQDASEEQDGRLTVQEVYGLELHANLVFLSACRSGLGQVSGDGINGLVRAFFFAGTPSVIASLWDVADETAQRLVTGFYRSWLSGTGKAPALRSTQLALLRALRAGEVKVKTQLGDLALAEDPVYWASFVLQGEP